MRGLYTHVSDRMRATLTKALQARWEDSLRDRADIHPHSPVPLLDELLSPHRRQHPAAVNPAAGTSLAAGSTLTAHTGDAVG
jgi:hypothetical protein